MHSIAQHNPLTNQGNFFIIQANVATEGIAVQSMGKGCPGYVCSIFFKGIFVYRHFGRFASSPPETGDFREGHKSNRAFTRGCSGITPYTSMPLPTTEIRFS
jgi:hypothetical protein